MAYEPVIRLDLERCRGALGNEICESRKEVIAKVLDDCKAQLTALDRAATDPSRSGIGFLVPLAERDLLEQRIGELQEGLRHLQRLTELGQVVSGLLHELIQPLAAISSYLAACQILLSGAPQPQIEQGLAQAAGQAVRARELVEKVRDFIR